MNTEILKEKYSQHDKAISRANYLISLLARKAFYTHYGLSNPVLSGGPWLSPLLHALLFQTKRPSKSTLVRTFIVNSIIYLGRSGLAWFRYLRLFMVGRKYIDGRINLLINADSLVIVDTYLLIDDVLNAGDYTDQYFNGLYEYLEENKKTVCIFPILIGHQNSQNIGKLLHALNRSKVPVIPEFSVLKPVDLMLLLFDIMAYPILTLVSLLNSRGETEDWPLSYSVAASLKQVNLNCFVRYRGAYRFGEMCAGRLNLISWFENQPIDKNLYSGFRKIDPDINIIGCQSYIYSKTHFNLFPTEIEHKLGLLPDHLLVNGVTYLAWHNHQFFRSVGLSPSFRYRYLFEHKFKRKNDELEKTPLVSLSQITQLSTDLIQVTKNTSFKSKVVRIRFHPTHTTKFKGLVSNFIPSQWIEDAAELYESLMKSSLFITSESGTALEAACLGVPVLILASQNSVTCNPMPEEGKGIIWDLVFDEKELEQAAEDLIKEKLARPQINKAWAEHYQHTFFNCPNKASMTNAFAERLH